MAEKSFKKNWLWKIGFALVLIVIGAALLPNLLAFIFNLGIIVLLVILILGFYFIGKLTSKDRKCKWEDNDGK